MDQQSTQDRTQLVEAVDTLREKLFAALDENAGQDEYVTLERQVKEAAQTLAAFDTAQLLARRYDPEIVSLKEQRERLAREWQYAKQELWGHQDRQIGRAHV